jgi:interferon gamma-inducible protein 30
MSVASSFFTEFQKTLHTRAESAFLDQSGIILRHRKKPIMLQPQQPERDPKRNAVLLLLGVVLVGGSLGLLSSLFVRSRCNGSDSSLVDVVLYGESLCPDCRHMVLDIIEPMLRNELGTLMSLRYVAYGNVKKTGSAKGGSANTNIQCQHGDKECLMNRYINCAQNDGVGSAEKESWFPYVACLAEDLAVLRDNSTYQERADECARKTGFSSAAMQRCAEGMQGNTLEVWAGEETESLTPKHTFVPWMTVNGIAIGSDYDNLDRYICAAVSGGSKGETLPPCKELRQELKHQF